MQILVVKPKTLNAVDKRKLRTAGIVSIEAERPQDVRLIGTEGPPMAGSDILVAALRALSADGNTALKHRQELFVKLLSEFATERRTAEDQP